MKQRLKIMRANIIILTLIVLGIVVLLNFLASKHHKRLDITAGGENTLSDQTLKLLKTLDAPLKVTVFDKTGGTTWVKAEKLLNTYMYYSKHMQTTYVDPDKKPNLATEYGIQRYGTLFFEYKTRREEVGNISEEAFANAILKLTRTEQKTVYFLTGHGENNLEAETKVGYSLLKDTVTKQNYKIGHLLLIRESKIPKDCSVLIISGPEKDFFPEELTVLEEYLQNGGNALFMLDPPPGIGLNDFLAKWGVKVGNDMVIDKLSRLFGGDYFMPVITTYSEHPITKGFNLPSFFPVTRSISPAKTPAGGVSAQILASTTQGGSWAEVDYKSKNYEFNEGKDQIGPVSVAVAVNIPLKGDDKKPHDHDPKHDHPHEDSAAKPGGRLVVLGDADFANNTYLNLSGNRDLFLNILNWLAEEESLISIRPKEKVERTINLTQSQMQGIFYLTVFGVPFMVFGIGLLVWFKRRT